jgi:hypothetical protein
MAHNPRVNRRKRAFTRARMARLDDEIEARELARDLGLLAADDVELAAFIAEDEYDDLAG